jgi:hypothetical protein
VTNRTRNNFRLCVQTLFSYAKSQRYLPADWNEMESVTMTEIMTERLRAVAEDQERRIARRWYG